MGWGWGLGVGVGVVEVPIATNNPPTASRCTYPILAPPPSSKRSYHRFVSKCDYDLRGEFIFVRGSNPLDYAGYRVAFQSMHPTMASVSVRCATSVCHS